MEWNENLTTLNYMLARLYGHNRTAGIEVAEKAGVNTNLIELEGNPNTFWYLLIKGANQQGKIIPLIERILNPNEKGGVADASTKQIIESVLNNIRTNSVPITNKAAEVEKKPEELPGNAEALMGSESTLLPISFLEKGLECAKSVVRVSFKGGSGSGFLVNDNWIITNNHVIKSREAADIALIQFNVQKTIDGLDSKSEDFRLDAAVFHTNAEDDWTCVKLKGDANEKYGALCMSETPAEKNDFVNIIQHPEGGPKQIALYHNMVTSVNDKYVFYLTDTLKGSSGSPVFNTNWEVVALHHWGGATTEAYTNLNVYRNRGINIIKIKKALHELDINV